MRPNQLSSHFASSLEWQAGMAELADAADSKSADPCGHGGSTPPPGTIKTLRGGLALGKIAGELGLSKNTTARIVG